MLKFIFSLKSETVRKNRFCTEATESEIEKIIKDWLRYAKDRDGGRREREEKKKKEQRNISEDADHQEATL